MFRTASSPCTVRLPSLRAAIALIAACLGLPAVAAAAPAEAATPAVEKISIWSGHAPIGGGTFEEADAAITVHRPPPERANGAAMVICPGGSYVIHRGTRYSKNSISGTLICAN